MPAPIGEGERAVVAAVHPMSFRAVFESLQKLPLATTDTGFQSVSSSSVVLGERGCCFVWAMQRRRLCSGSGKVYDLLPENPASGKER